MSQWHERLSAKIGLRLGGLALLASAWFEGARLYDLVAQNSAAEATMAQLMLAGLMFLSASAGMALTIVGAGLWESVTISDRWATKVPIPVCREFEPALFAMTAAQGDAVQQQGRDHPHDGERSPIRHSHLSPQRRG